MLVTSVTRSAIPATVLITYGRMSENALAALDILHAEGRSVGLIALERLAPYTELARELLPHLDGVRQILFVEEGVRQGGAGLLLGDALATMGALSSCRYAVSAIDDPFAVPDTLCDLDDLHGLSPTAIAKALLDLFP